MPKGIIIYGAQGSGKTTVASLIGFNERSFALLKPQEFILAATNTKMDGIIGNFLHVETMVVDDADPDDQLFWQMALRLATRDKVWINVIGDGAHRVAPPRLVITTSRRPFGFNLSPFIELWLENAPTNDEEWEETKS